MSSTEQNPKPLAAKVRTVLIWVGKFILMAAAAVIGHFTIKFEREAVELVLAW